MVRLVSSPTTRVEALRQPDPIFSPASCYVAASPCAGCVVGDFGPSSCRQYVFGPGIASALSKKSLHRHLRRLTTKLVRYDG